MLWSFLPQGLVKWRVSCLMARTPFYRTPFKSGGWFKFGDFGHFGDRTVTFPFFFFLKQIVLLTNQVKYTAKANMCSARVLTFLSQEHMHTRTEMYSQWLLPRRLMSFSASYQKNKKQKRNTWQTSSVVFFFDHYFLLFGLIVVTARNWPWTHRCWQFQVEDWGHC